MFDSHNKAQLDALSRAGEGSAGYVHARTHLAIAPTPAMRARFDGRAHTGLIRVYNNKYQHKLFVVDHSPADRREFEDCISECGYGGWKIEYTD